MGNGYKIKSGVFYVVVFFFLVEAKAKVGWGLKEGRGFVGFLRGFLECWMWLVYVVVIWNFVLEMEKGF